MKDLKPKEQAIYEYIKDTLEKVGYAPSVRDICAALNIKSTSTVHIYLSKLEEKGLIQKENGKSRTLRIDMPQGAENSYKVPLLGQVAAGTPIMTVENFDGYLDFSSHKTYPSNSLFALKVTGESMIDIGIYDGDIVIVEQREYADNGEIVVAMIDDSATVKRFFKESGRVRLQPENSTMQPIYARDVSILGKVIACVRYY